MPERKHYFARRKDHGDEEEHALLAETDEAAMEETLEILGWEVMEISEEKWEEMLK